MFAVDYMSFGLIENNESKLTRQQEHCSFFNMDIPKLTLINHLEQHTAFILIEPLFRFVDVIICPLPQQELRHELMPLTISRVRAAHYHDCVVSGTAATLALLEQSGRDKLVEAIIVDLIETVRSCAISFQQADRVREA